MGVPVSHLLWRWQFFCAVADPIDWSGRSVWRMPPLEPLAPARLTPLARIWMVVLRFYLVVAGGLVLVWIVQLATAGPG